MPGLEGQNIGEFQILSKLGQGGMGTVYVARQSSLNRSVAIKVLPSHLAEDTTFIQRFHREATVAASLSHPDIVQALAAGEHEGTHYFAMEYVDGESLLMRLSREGRLDPAEALAITVRVAQALNYAWQKVRLIHRDIKPSNILISKEGQVKLADLGMAKCIGEDTNHLTSSGMTLGTPHYTSPEQARSCADIDFRADIYSLGCTLYQMLTGQTPYKGSDSLAVMYQHVNDPPPDILKVMPDCPPVIVRLLNKMLTKDRNHRQQSYDELIEEMVAAHNQTPQQSIPASNRRSHVLTYAMLATTVIIIAVGVLVWAPWKSHTVEPAQARGTSHTEQYSQATAATVPPDAGAKHKTPSSPSTSVKPVSDASLSAISLGAGDKNTAPSSTVIRTTVTTQPIPPAATTSGSGPVISFEPRKTSNMVTTATSVSSGTTVASTETEAAKHAPVMPTPSPNNQPSVTDNETSFLKSVASLPPAQQVTQVMARLKELNPQFDGKETHKIENGAVTELAFSTVGIADITPLKALKWLKKLSIAPPGTNQKGALSDLSPLVGLPLTGLWCHGNAIGDLSPVKDMPLTILSCGGTQIKDLAPLAGMKLTVLSFNDTEVADLGPLKSMPLTVLWCNNTKITDLSLLNTMSLQELKCDFVAERDTAILHDIRTLAKINDMPVATFWMRVGPVASRPPSLGVKHKPATPVIAAKPSVPEKTMKTTTGMELVWIPPGEFMLGSTPEERTWANANGCKVYWTNQEGEQPRRTAIIEGFWLGRTELTVGQWRKFVEATHYVTDGEKHAKDTWRQPKAGFKIKDNHPVCCVSWNDAVTYCAWLTEVETKANKLPKGMVYRLPTEAEWEYACRAGKQTKFWWGDETDGCERRLNFSGSPLGISFLSPVDHYGTHGRNGFGLADMLGNVWEWCLDELDPAQAHSEYYSGNPGSRVLRGGSCLHYLSFQRCAVRRPCEPDGSENQFGIRVLCGVRGGSGQPSHNTGPLGSKR